MCWRAVPPVLTCCLHIGPNRNSVEPCSGPAGCDAAGWRVVWLLIGVVAVSLGTEITTTTDVQEDRSSSHCVDTAHASVGTYYIVRPRLCCLCELTTVTTSPISQSHSFTPALKPTYMFHSRSDLINASAYPPTNVLTDYTKQVLSSSWDGRPFGHNRHGPKIVGRVPFGGGSWVPI